MKFKVGDQALFRGVVEVEAIEANYLGVKVTN